MEFLTREFFDTLIFIVIGIGLILAAFRLYQDFNRPLPRSHQQYDRHSDENLLDTRETPVVREESLHQKGDQNTHDNELV